MSSTAAASGTLMKKIHRQENVSTSHPPSTGPTPAAIAVNPDQVPIACPRRSREKLALMSARLPGTRSAAPIPCTPRATTSWVMCGASPHQIDATAKSATPDGEDAPPAQTVPQRSAGEDQRGEHEGVGFDDPLRLGDARAEFALQHREHDVDHGAVDEGDARAEDRRRQHPASGCRSAAPHLGLRQHDRFVAGLADGVDHRLPALQAARGESAAAVGLAQGLIVSLSALVAAAEGQAPEVFGCRPRSSSTTSV